MDSVELDRLIIENLADLDAAAKRIEEIGSRIEAHLTEHVGQCAVARGWQHGNEDGLLWIAPPLWAHEGSADTFFSFGWGPNDTGEGSGHEAYFDLSRYCGAAGAQFCLWFESGMKLRAWKLLVPKIEEVPGFLLSDDPYYYTPCTLDPKLVALGLEDDDLTTAFGPVTRVLELAFQAEPKLTRLLKAEGQL